MTVHQFLTMLVEACESVDMGDTEIRISTPNGDYQPYTFRWEDTGEDTDEGLVLDVLGVEDED